MSEEARAVIQVAVTGIGLVVMSILGYWTAFRIHHKPTQRWAPPCAHQTPVTPETKDA